MFEPKAFGRPAFLALAALLASPAAVSAARQGEFDVTYSADLVAEGEWLPIGPDLRQRMNVLELAATGAGGFLGTTSATCHYTQEEDARSGAYRNVGWCAWRGGDGDLLFESWEGGATNGGATLFGTGRLAGGTGKFAGATGSLSFSYGESGRQRGYYELPSQ